MAAIFTPGLKVLERTIVQKERLLPMQGEVAVRLGERVTADQVVARTELPGKVYPVNVANQLGVDPGQLPEAMRKQRGEPVEEGEPVARVPGFLGLFPSEARAPVAGTIESVSAVTGQVIFQARPVPVQIDAYIPGTVVELRPGEGCVVQARAALVQGIFGLGGEVKAPLHLLSSAPDERIEAAVIEPRHKGLILVGGAFITLEALRRAVELGVAGVVTGGFDYDDIKALLGYEVGVAITGGERLGLTLMVTEGFGSIPMAPATWALLRRMAGRRASLNGATQIRAGVIRPEVVVPHEDDDLPVERMQPPPPRGLQLGDTVRGIRSPWFGRIGRVVGLPVEPVRLESGSLARVMEVEFREEDGGVRRALLPRSNVESIEREG